MAIYFVESATAPCPQCRRATLHHRNNSKANWLLHLLIGLVTFLIWPVLVMVFRALTKAAPGPWICAECGAVPRSYPQRVPAWLSIGLGLLLVGMALLVLGLILAKGLGAF